MSGAELALGSPKWAALAAGLFAVAAAAVWWSYARAGAGRRVTLVGAVLKGVGFAALALCLVEPLLVGSRPRPGANAFVILADDSQSLRVRDAEADGTRGEAMKALLRDGTAWKTRLGQEFDVRNYAFDANLRAVSGPDELTFDGTGSALGTSLDALGRRFRNLPLAGVLLLTDGVRTDAATIKTAGLPPVYPVLPPAGGAAKDVSVRNVSVSQANFEAAPVVVQVEVTAAGFGTEPVVAAVLDEAGAEVERQQATPTADGNPLAFRFQFRPETRGLNFYTVRAFAASDEAAADANGDPAKSAEQTLANNGRLVVVDQGAGPHRVLYVAGRPNWEFKFLRRAVAGDEQVELVGLLRIAKRQPKFDFQRAGSRTASPLFDGFDDPDAETADAADEPVLVRLGTRDETELRTGFPKTADELYGYEAVILDDIEAGFFSPDQQALLRNFVSVRGGGLLMLGGPDSFAAGGYDRTPVGDLLPVYPGRKAAEAAGGGYRLSLTREGWLQPWVRTRKTEDDERRRLAGMPAFETLSRTGGLKPGAVVLAEARDDAGGTVPALAAQPFGRGHVAAMTVGDFWRWGLRRQTPEEDDFDRAWRQTVRWLVADVPGRVELDLASDPASPAALRLTARVRDADYRPLDDAKVAVTVTLPGGETLTLDAEPAGGEPGVYATTYVPKTPGPYRFTAAATAADGSTVGEAVTGYAAQPAADEFARLEPDRAALEALAAATGGEVIDPAEMDAFAASLSGRKAPITEPWTSPLWHNPLYFLLAIACLAGEWGWRRVHGLR